MKIFFLENSISFNASDINSSKLGGTEKTLINITNELAKNIDFEVKVFNKNKLKKVINNVEWNYIDYYNDNIIPDVLIAFSDINLFKNYKSDKKFLWSHSIQSLEKFIRKKQFVPYLKHQPVLILEGDYHYKNRHLLTSFFGKKILKLAPDYDFINEEIDLNFIPDNNCIFTTKSDRNLKILTSAWNKIYSSVNNAKLYINPPFNITNNMSNQNIILREKGDKKKLIDDLKKSKLMLVPGHKGEVFCLAAEEARELCIPIVTMGYGSLYERVIHNETGFIAKNEIEFFNFSINLLNDNNLFLKFKRNLFNMRNSRNYSNVADDLIKIINN